MSFPAMNPWFAKAIILVGTLALVIIPACLHHRGGEIKVVKSRKGPMERVLLTLTSLGFFLPLVWVATPVLRFADYPLRLVPISAGIFCLVLGLWLLYRSHADLGTNWSITLEVREKYQLVTKGIYRFVRHPMYLALLLYASGQGARASQLGSGPVLPRRLRGPLRLLRRARRADDGGEFGKDYEAYMARIKRLVPGVW